ncbi:MAG TPA: MFS transporter [Bacteroidota bacterium]|nr:MFS transporter [Bacteroidota bacterium]
MKRQKLIILMTVLVDVIGFGIVIPILPFYVSEFGASALMVTVLFATYSVCSFLSSPFLGALSDRIGRRPVLLFSIASTAVGWFVFASAAALPLLFIGRIIDGLAAGNFSIAQSYLVDLAKDEKDRTANIGLLGAAFGIGFTLGPVIGGTLSKFSHATPFYFAGALATLNVIVAYFTLPETNFNRSTAKITYHPFAPIRRALQAKSIHPMLLTWIAFAVAQVISQSLFALFTQRVFGFSSFTTGMLFTSLGIIIVINQAALLKRFWLPNFSDGQLDVLMFSILAVAVVMIASMQEWLFFLSLPLLGTGQGILRTAITSRTAGAVDPTMKGETLGILSSLMSVAMAVVPVAAGVLFEMHPSIPYFLSGAVLLSGIYFSRLTPSNSPAS